MKNSIANCGMLFIMALVIVEVINPVQGMRCGKPFIPCKDNTDCILEKERCDGVDNCKDGSDEKNCINICLTDFFRCISDHLCKEKSVRCNGIKECVDNSDEVDCPNLINLA